MAFSCSGLAYADSVLLLAVDLQGEAKTDADDEEVADDESEDEEPEGESEDEKPESQSGDEETVADAGHVEGNEGEFDQEEVVAIVGKDEEPEGESDNEEEVAVVIDEAEGPECQSIGEEVAHVGTIPRWARAGAHAGMDYADPMGWVHFKGEGDVEFKNQAALSVLGCCEPA
eukprot:1155993-Pelagomonas_calceolata.AAC.7